MNTQNAHVCAVLLHPWAPRLCYHSQTNETKHPSQWQPGNPRQIRGLMQPRAAVWSGFHLTLLQRSSRQSAPTKGVLTGGLSENKHCQNELWVQVKVIAPSKGHSLSKQKACCFASGFISAILKWVKEDRALNRNLINKVLCSRVELPTPSSQRSFPHWTSHLSWLLKPSSSQKGKMICSMKHFRGQTIHIQVMNHSSCPIKTHLCVCFVLLKSQSLFSLTGHGSI